MVKRKIQLSRERVAKFVKAANDCPFKIELCYDHIVVDAKSILGVYSLDLSRILTVIYPENEKMTEEFSNLLNSYEVAC
ncbi:MAG: HPr family phosphocarrier protein [Lachnospiraceae bacterium]